MTARPFKTKCISLYVDDLERLNRLAHRDFEAGLPDSHSSIIRRALDHYEQSGLRLPQPYAVPAVMGGGQGLRPRCPVCQSAVGFTRDGRMRTHQPGELGMRQSRQVPECKGSGYSPEVALDLFCRGVA